jgi:hypothetical protein
MVGASLVQTSIRAEGACHETRSHSRRTAVLLSREVERADLAGHTNRQHGLRLGFSAVRSANQRAFDIEIDGVAVME